MLSFFVVRQIRQTAKKMLGTESEHFYVYINYYLACEEANTRTEAALSFSYQELVSVE